MVYGRSVAGRQRAKSLSQLSIRAIFYCVGSNHKMQLRYLSILFFQKIQTVYKRTAYWNRFTKDEKKIDVPPEPCHNLFQRFLIE